MPRARNIKHSFFTNDELGELEPIDRLAFIGLWTLADYRGNLEWRPKKIKTLILPYDDCDMNKIAINLDKSGFIRMYSDGETMYLNICKFTDHQNPHKNEREKGTDIPDYSEKMRQLVDLKGLTINRDKSGLIPEYSHSNRADSLFLNPDSLILIADYIRAHFMSFEALKRKKKPLEIPESINLIAWNEWLDFRKAKKKPVSEIAAKKNFTLLAKYSKTEQQEIINNSIKNDYQGLFDLKKQSKQEESTEVPNEIQRLIEARREKA